MFGHFGFVILFEIRNLDLEIKDFFIFRCSFGVLGGEFFLVSVHPVKSFFSI